MDATAVVTVAALARKEVIADLVKLLATTRRAALGRRSGGGDDIGVVRETALVTAVALATLEVEADARRPLLLLATLAAAAAGAASTRVGAFLTDVHPRALVAEAAGATCPIAALLAGDVAEAVRAEARVVLAVRVAAGVATVAAALITECEAFAGSAATPRRDRLALGVLELAVLAVAARAVIAVHAAHFQCECTYFHCERTKVQVGEFGFCRLGFRAERRVQLYYTVATAVPVYRYSYTRLPFQLPFQQYYMPVPSPPGSAAIDLSF